MEQREDKHGRVDRQEWAKRVERWRDSGLTAAEFAAELGINARTLVYWKWRLGKEREPVVGPSSGARRGSRAATKSQPSSVADSFVEVQVAGADTGFELELSRGRRLRVPASFDASGLRRLLDVLEAT